MFNCCFKIVEAIRGLKIPQNISCDIPQPLEVSIPQPLEISGSITCNSVDACAEGMAKILSQSSSYTELVFDIGEQYQKVTDLTVDGSVVSFSSQGQKIQTTLCKIEYVVL